MVAVLVVLVELVVSVRPDEVVEVVDDVVEVEVTPVGSVASVDAVPSVGALVWLADSLPVLVAEVLLVLPDDDDSVVATLSPQATASKTPNQQWRAIRSRLARAKDAAQSGTDW